LLGILAQRLVRRLCKKCKAPYHPTEEEFKVIVDHYGAAEFEKTGIRYTPDLKLNRTVGCPDCAGSGYRGRLGIHELLVGTDAIKSLIQHAARVEEIRNQAIADGMTTLMQDGILKVFQGNTDFAQVRSACIK
jgi:type II secretory ATPase GspE/PulE/Tfp pilus assembly ATPase PilB-like protein